MKKFLAPILLLTFLFPSLAYGETMDDLIFRPGDGLTYNKSTNTPFTGKVTGKGQRSFKKGKRDGPWVTYHNNGRLWVRATYKDGKIDGLWTRFDMNGQGREKQSYKDGKKDGLWVGYWENGQLFVNGNYKNNTKDGSWIGYWKNGDLRIEGSYKDGKECGRWVKTDRGGQFLPYYPRFYKECVEVD
jgi:antitoxin component YwqK of YwqJK toxin-antitoxin module